MSYMPTCTCADCENYRATALRVSIAPASEPAEPKLPGSTRPAGTRVWLAGDREIARDYPTADRWLSVGGTLLLQDPEGDVIAEYPPNCWVGVEDIYEEAS